SHLNPPTICKTLALPPFGWARHSCAQHQHHPSEDQYGDQPPQGALPPSEAVSHTGRNDARTGSFLPFMQTGASCKLTVAFDLNTVEAFCELCQEEKSKARGKEQSRVRGCRKSLESIEDQTQGLWSHDEEIVYPESNHFRGDEATSPTSYLVISYL
ncbi:hypothetical protein STEG23_012462, partial [Scotinomys teguina]